MLAVAPSAIPSSLSLSAANITPAFVPSGTWITASVPVSLVIVIVVGAAVTVKFVGAVMLAVPLKETPLIDLAVSNAVAVEEFPVKGPVKFPVTVPVKVGLARGAAPIKERPEEAFAAAKNAEISALVLSAILS